MTEESGLRAREAAERVYRAESRRVFATLTAGLRGIEEKLPLPPEFKGNAYESDVQRFPHALRDAIGGMENGSMARPAFGDDVIDHYLNYARTEQGLFDKVVTGYERERLFERG